MTIRSHPCAPLVAFALAAVLGCASRAVPPPPEQPVLEPGQSFRYTSGCPLATDVGMMEGSYQMVTADGEMFDIAIAPFTLSESDVVH